MIVSKDLVFWGNPGRGLILNKEIENVQVFHFLLKGLVRMNLILKRSLRVPGPLGPLRYHQLRVRLLRLKSLILIVFAAVMRIIIDEVFRHLEYCGLASMTARVLTALPPFVPPLLLGGHVSRFL